MVVGDEDVGERVARLGLVENGRRESGLNLFGLLRPLDARIHFLRKLLDRAFRLDVVVDDDGAQCEQADGENARAHGEEVGDYDEDNRHARNGVEPLVGGHGGIGEHLPPGGEEDVGVFCPKLRAIVRAHRLNYAVALQ